MITPVSSPLIEKYKKRLSLPESIEKPFVKNGCTIDGRAYFAKYSSVFTDKDGTLYQAHLGFSDISRNLNNFYKLQLFKHDKKEEYYLYRSWGRIGTPGGLKLECFNKDIDRALKEFKRIFFEKTDLWENRKNFVKHPCLHDIIG
uniref:WGR domain-containing protein n=1 Tax=Panagrolaimus sp. PS1159 TaxID=55785 RepID=A0AC35GF05_9BILA